MNDSDGTAASLFFQQPTTQLDASSSSWTFNHDGHFLVDSNLGRWNLQQQEKEELRGLFSDSREASLTLGATHKLVKQADCDEIQAVVSSQRVPEGANVSSFTSPKRMESFTGHKGALALASLLLPRERGLSSRPSLSSSPGFFFSGAYPLSQPVDTTHDAAPPRIPKRMPSLFDCVEIQAVFSQLVPEDANVSSPTMPKRMESLTDYDYILAALPSLPPPQGRGLLLPSSSPGFFFSGANPPRIPFRRKSIMMLDAAQK